MLAAAAAGPGPRGAAGGPSPGSAALEQELPLALGTSGPTGRARSQCQGHAGQGRCSGGTARSPSPRLDAALQAGVHPSACPVPSLAGLVPEQEARTGRPAWSQWCTGTCARSKPQPVACLCLGRRSAWCTSPFSSLEKRLNKGKGAVGTALPVSL